MLQTVATAFNSVSTNVYQYPVRWAAFIRSLILCGSAFGLHINSDQLAVLMLVVESGLAVLTHQQVTPNVTVEKDKLLARAIQFPTVGGM